MTSVTRDPEGTDLLNERSTLSIGLVAMIVGWLVAALMAYSAFDSRVSVIENQMRWQNTSIEEVKSDVKQLLRQTK